MAEFRTHYSNLQVAENASPEVIKGAYKFLCQKWHPDKHPNNRELAEKNMRIINEAYAVLSNSDRRKAHDFWIKQQREGANTRTDKSRKENSTQDTDPSQSESTDQYSDGTKPDEHETPGHLHLHPWSRYWARGFDTLVSGLVIYLAFLFTLEFLWPDFAEELYIVIDNVIVSSLLMFALWIPVEALFIKVTSTTPAKWIFGITIKKSDGRHLTFSESLSRSYLVWVQGMGLTIPPVGLFTNYFAYRRLNRTGTTLWDRSVGSVVDHKKWGALRVITVITFCSVSFIGYMFLYAWSVEDHQSTIYDRKVDSLYKSYGFEVSNECRHPISVIIRYHDPDEYWYTVGWWDVPAYSSKQLDFESQSGPNTKNAVWYYYAESTDESDLIWSGDYSFEYEGIEIPMVRLQDKHGVSDWTLTCD